MVRVLNRRRHRELADRLGQPAGIVGHLDALWDLRLRQPLRVNDGIFALDLLPLEALLAAGRVETLAVLPGCIEQTSRDFSDYVAVLDLEGGRLQCKGTVVALDQVVANPARAVAHDALGVLAEQGQTGADAMRRVVHRRQTRPVIGPTVHVLLMTTAQKLNPAQLALVVQLLDEQVLPAVDDRLHHHVNLAALPLGLDELLALLDRRCHRNRTGDMLAGV